MKREEHYCDICGKQMTYQDSSDDQNWQGVRVYGHGDEGKRYAHDELWASMSKPHSCGSSSKGEGQRGTEFCSFECFEKSITDWLDRCRSFLK